MLQTNLSGLSKPFGWCCSCSPYRATFRGRGGPKLMLVHHVSCDRPVEERQIVTIVFPPKPHIRGESLTLMWFDEV